MLIILIYFDILEVGKLKESLVYEKAFKFAIRIVNLYKHLCKEENEYIISKQVIRLGTSIGANTKEVVQASSKKVSKSKGLNYK